ncbi:hypothetical protein EVAR_89602_1 [Eumeta japonica]|uniref:Uncharacterized protein n=1 Tax=Eumeta variegata TaxID=151549 RepID=A0A4C1XKX7_EUMVA|nr:hypothetical protein EVAR_89602_1 [Eumeta japonica]
MNTGKIQCKICAESSHKGGYQYAIKIRKRYLENRNHSSNIHSFDGKWKRQIIPSKHLEHGARQIRALAFKRKYVRTGQFQNRYTPRVSRPPLGQPGPSLHLGNTRQGTSAYACEQKRQTPPKATAAARTRVTEIAQSLIITSNIQRAEN